MIKSFAHKGLKEFYETGVLMKETPYLHGDKEGMMKVYYENEVLKEETPYKRDKKDGVSDGDRNYVVANTLRM